MKGEIKKRVLCLLVVLCLLLFSCSEGEDAKKAMRVALITDYSSIDDKSFNQITWEGICRWAKENNLPDKNYVYQSSQITIEDYALCLANFADRHFDLIIAPGFAFAEPVEIVAQKYPKQRFLLIDAIAKGKGNVVSATFANHEGSFLAGVVAALKAKEINSKKLGFIGGFDNVVIREFEAGFEAGAKAIDPDMDVWQEYVEDYSNPGKGQRVAGEMYDKGVCVIFNVAGGTGLGIIKEARKRARAGKKVFVVGVDRDQYEDGIYAEKKSVILTSMLKKVDVASYDTLSRMGEGRFQPGHVVYALKNNGVGLPEKNPNLKKEWCSIVRQYEHDIVYGKIVVPKVPQRIKTDAGS